MTPRSASPVASVVRLWTWVYTLGLPPALRDARRAEIESDLWDLEHEAEQHRGLSPAVQMWVRLLLGFPDDLLWRLTHATVSKRAMQMGGSLTVTLLVLAVLFVLDSMRTRRLPLPPDAAVLSAPAELGADPSFPGSRIRRQWTEPRS